MRRYLLVAVWPAGITAIAAATIRAARRAPRASATGSSGPLLPALRGLAAAAAAPQVAVSGASLLARPAQGGERSGRQVPGWVSDLAAQSSWPGGPAWAADLARLGAMSCAGAALSYGVMALLGPTVVNHGPAIDEPIVRWTSSHQVRRWAQVTERLGKIGNTWTTWGATMAAAVCLGTTWRTRKWLPPAALASAILVDKYVTLALRHRFGRPGPPGSPGGTYPSGGCDRVVFLYGLVAYLLWHEFSGSESGKVWAIGAVTALSFNEAYSRQYLSKHWFTDIMSGLLYGAVLLAPFIAAVRLIAGPAAVTGPGGPC